MFIEKISEDELKKFAISQFYAKLPFAERAKKSSYDATIRIANNKRIVNIIEYVYPHTATLSRKSVAEYQFSDFAYIDSAIYKSSQVGSDGYYSADFQKFMRKKLNEEDKVAYKKEAGLYNQKQIVTFIEAKNHETNKSANL